MTWFRPTRRPSIAEFVPLMAFTSGLDALSTDSVLPALPALGRDLGVAAGNDAQLVVAAMFFGMSFGQLFGGPLSDSYGRRPTFIAGLLLYLVGCLAGMLAPDFTVMLLARVVQGIGASIPFVIVMALVRDQYEGPPMARIMSFIGAVFILVPMIAPLAGQGILLIASWRAIFLLYVVLGIAATLWFAARQPETLAPENRHPLTLDHLGGATLEVIRHPVARGYMVAGGCLFGAFLGYLNSAQQIFQDAYGAGVYFALLFSFLAFSIGIALYLNGKLVERFGMQRLTFAAGIGMMSFAILFLPVAWAWGGVPPLPLTMLYLVLTFVCVGVMFGNINALAMEPLGHIAGIGAAIIGFAQTILGLPIGTLVGQAFNGTVLPLASGFAVFGGLGLAAMAWAERGRPAAR